MDISLKILDRLLTCPYYPIRVTKDELEKDPLFLEEKEIMTAESISLFIKGHKMITEYVFSIDKVTFWAEENDLQVFFSPDDLYGVYFRKNEPKN